MPEVDDVDLLPVADAHVQLVPLSSRRTYAPVELVVVHMGVELG